MSALGVILLAIFFWFMYNLVVKLVIPVYKTTRQLRKQFGDMTGDNHSYKQDAETPKNNPPKQEVGEYIEFEEVK